MKISESGFIRINFRATDRFACNYNCSYCGLRFHSAQLLNERDFVEIMNIWSNLASLEDKISVKININGELFFSNYGYMIVQYISSLQNVAICEINTNASLIPLNELTKYRDKIRFNCSFHPEFIAIDSFIENLLKVKQKGFKFFANTMAIPGKIEDLHLIFKRFKNDGIRLKLTGLNGGYNGKEYPRAYNDFERNTIRMYMDSDEEYKLIIDWESVENELCFAGCDMINIFLDGSIKRCFYDNLGTVSDLVNGRLKLKENPYFCNNKICGCYSHIIGLKYMRDKYHISDDFVDLYAPFVTVNKK